MKVVIAPDSFKDALTASDAVNKIAHGLCSVSADLQIDRCPIADGGEGFVDAIAISSLLSSRRVTKTFDPLMREIDSDWIMLQAVEGKTSTAVIELAAASGLETLACDERNPCETSTYGTGKLIERALFDGAKQIILGIGGSATNDAGMGIVQALGYESYRSDGDIIRQAITGSLLERIAEFHPIPTEHFAGVRFTVACDVTNPMTGPNGAAYVYAPQKGATPEQVVELDAGLRHMAQLWREQLGIDVEHLPGAGAAGGVGGGLVAMLGAELVPGAELVLDTIGFDERIKDADLVITGEGRLDSQSLQGKAAVTVAKRCKRAGVPCVALVGSVGEGADEALNHGLSAYYVIGKGLPAEESIRRTGELLETAAVKLAQDRLMS